MNGKQAKRLRKAAIGMAAYMVETGRTIHPDQHVKPQLPQPVDPETLGPVMPKNRPYSSQLPSVPKRSETEVNKADSLRGIYRYLKKSK